MEHVAGAVRLQWVRMPPDAPAPPDSEEVLYLRVERAEADGWRALGTGEPMLSVFPAAAPLAMQVAALVVFARILEEAGPARWESMLTHLLWYELTDKDILTEALRRTSPTEITPFLFALAQLEPRAAQRAISMASDAQLAAITADDATVLVRHPNPAARAPLLLALRENAKRLTGLRA